MLFKRVRPRIRKPAGRHLAADRADEQTPTAAGRHVAPRARRWRLIPAAAALLALVCLATVAGREAAATSTGGGPATTTTKITPTTTATGDETAAAQPKDSASRVLAALGTGMVDPAVKPYLDPKQLAAVPVGSGKVAKPVHEVLDSTRVTTALDDNGIPAVALQAYQQAANVLAGSDASCHLPWQLLAAIGRVESDHGRFGGSVLLPNGYGTRPIFGIPLDGRPGVGLVRDTDGGRLDGDPNFDRAVGPMQFIPSTWAEVGVDGNGDGKADPNNIFDAALAAARYLCAGGGNLADPAEEAAAVRRYNDADDYVRVVIALATSYERGDAATVPTTDIPGPVTSGSGSTAGSNDGGWTDPVPPPVAKVPSRRHTAPPVQPTTGTKQPTHTAARAPRPRPTRAAKPTSAPTQAPTRTPTQAPTRASSQAPKPQPTRSAAPSATSTPTGTESTTPAAAPTPTVTPTTAAPPGQTPTDTAKPNPTSAPHRPLVTHCADVGWAPAMRKVVIGLLTGPTARHPGHAGQTRSARHEAPTDSVHHQGPVTEPRREDGAPSHKRTDTATRPVRLQHTHPVAHDDQDHVDDRGSPSH